MWTANLGRMWAAALLSLWVGSVAAPSMAFAERAALGEHALEGRLFAPCCYTQTLDIHDSDLASALRKEIHERLANGEASGVVEADLVARYGDKILAVPTGRDPRGQIVWVTLSAMGVALVAFFFAARRWLRKPFAATSLVPDGDASFAGSTVAQALDARIDAELQKLRS